MLPLHAAREKIRKISDSIKTATGSKWNAVAQIHKIARELGTLAT